MATSIPVTAQHYLVCGTEDCEKNCQFYCNHCHRQLCEQCRDEHQRSPETKNHEVVPFLKHKRHLPVDKCKLHPTRNADILCDECNIPLCSKCTTMEEHFGHKFVDMEDIDAEKFAFCLEEIYKIQEYFLPTSQGLKKETNEDGKKVKKIMDDFRNAIKEEAKSLKDLVDKVTSDKLEQANTIEKSLLKVLKEQEKTYNDYNNYLEKLAKEFYGYLPLSNFKVLLSAQFENSKIQYIPETTKPVPPVFTAGQFSYDDVKKLLGNIDVPNIKPDKRKIKPIATSSTQLKPTGKEMKQDREKSGGKQTLSLSSSVTKVREYTVPGVYDVWHISLGKSGRLWVSDIQGNLVHTDLQGNQLQKIQTNGGDGHHTVTQDGDLIYTDRKNKVINRIKQDNTITEFIKTGDWEPLSIHSSHINGDILVGMVKVGESKVTRYTKTGEEIQNIQRNNNAWKLYGDPRYITENINGDICISDYNKLSVVVVNKSGQHRFSNRGQGSGFWPYGICTDLLGHIIVCNRYLMMDNKVLILNQDGHLLSLLLTPQQGIKHPRGLCVDGENNLHVGQWNTNTVTVYKYLQ